MLTYVLKSLTSWLNGRTMEFYLILSEMHSSDLENHEHPGNSILMDLQDSKGLRWQLMMSDGQGETPGLSRVANRTSEERTAQECTPLPARGAVGAGDVRWLSTQRRCRAGLEGSQGAPAPPSPPGCPQRTPHASAPPRVGGVLWGRWGSTGCVL